MKFLFVLFSFLIITNHLSAKTEMKDLEFHAMENFSVEKRNDRIYVGFDYVITNPNWYSIVIMPSSLFLRIAEQDCGWVSVDEKLKVKAKTKAGYHFVLSGSTSQFSKSTFSSIWSMMSGKGIPFHIAGKLKAGVSLLRIKIAVDYTYNMTFDEFLSFF